MNYNKVLTFSKAAELAEILNTNGFDTYGIKIVTKVKRDILDKLNEDYYYRAGGQDKPVEAASINVNLDGVTFIYELDENSEGEELDT